MKSTKIHLLLAACSIILLNSCVKDPDGFGYNILDDPNVEIIKIKALSFEAQGPAYSNIACSVSTVIDEMPPEQQALIQGFVLYVNGNKRGSFDFPRDWFVEKDKLVGTTRCYSFAFKSVIGEESKRTNEYCFVVE